MPGTTRALVPYAAWAALTWPGASRAQNVELPWEADVEFMTRVRAYLEVAWLAMSASPAWGTAQQCGGPPGALLCRDVWNLGGCTVPTQTGSVTVSWIPFNAYEDELYKLYRPADRLTTCGECRYGSAFCTTPLYKDRLFQCMCENCMSPNDAAACRQGCAGECASRCGGSTECVTLCASQCDVHCADAESGVMKDGVYYGSGGTPSPVCDKCWATYACECRSAPEGESGGSRRRSLLLLFTLVIGTMAAVSLGMSIASAVDDNAVDNIENEIDTSVEDALLKQCNAFKSGNPNLVSRKRPNYAALGCGATPEPFERQCSEDRSKYKPGSGLHPALTREYVGHSEPYGVSSACLANNMSRTSPICGSDGVSSLFGTCISVRSLRNEMIN